MVTGTELAEGWFNASPFVSRLGLKLISLTDGVAEIKMPFDGSLATTGELLHGGAIAALIDTAATAAAWAGAEPPDPLRGTTVDLSLSFIAGATAEDVTALAKVVRRGRTLTFIEVEAKTDGDSVVAKALVTYKLG